MYNVVCNFTAVCLADLLPGILITWQLHCLAVRLHGSLLPHGYFTTRDHTLSQWFNGHTILEFSELNCSAKKEPAQWASSSSMPAAGVEPALPLGERDFKSRASANSAMPAGTICNPPKHGLFCCVNSSIKLPLLHHFWCSGPSGTRTQDRPVMSREL